MRGLESVLAGRFYGGRAAGASLLFSCETGGILAMSTKAQAILDEIRALPPEEREDVLDEALRLRDRMLQWEQQKARLREIQSRHVGRGLLKRLLEERAKERFGMKFDRPHC